MTRRFDFIEGDENTVSEMAERQNGDWVMFDDYHALVVERDELRTIIADAIERLRDA